VRKILFGRILPLAVLTGAVFASLTLYNSGGQVIATRGVDFLIPRGARRPSTFYVVIGDDQLTIDSGELEKYKAP
jgi:hypothetical protein